MHILELVWFCSAEAALITKNPAKTETAAAAEKAVGAEAATSQEHGRMKSDKMARGTVSDIPTVATAGVVRRTA